MSYQPSIPAANDLISVSQSAIQTNFSQLNTVFGIDHVTLSPAVADSGKHNKVTLPQQGSDPSTAALEGAIYTKDVSGTMQLVYRDQNDGSITPIFGSGTTASTGTYTFPNGLIMKWGTSASSTSPNAVSFAAAFPNNCFNVQVTNKDNSFGAFPNVTAVTTTGFQVTWTNGGSNVFYWTAIGN